jgi:electron transport complex protein RnfC
MCVEPGQGVLKGQLLAVGDEAMTVALHAPTSGRIVEVAEHSVPYPVGGRGTCIVLEPDGEQRWIERTPLLERAPAAILNHLQKMGVIGLGGAGFPSHVKLIEALQSPLPLLVINGVECEPYISCDHQLMRERASEVIGGASILNEAACAERCVIAVEEDMPAAFEALRAAAVEDIEILPVPAIYPAGGEKQLIKTLTGLEVPSGGLPVDVGVLMFNVATAAAAYRAVILGEPLIERYVTVTGAVESPANRRVLIGTPVASILESFDVRSETVLLGGPMMGVQLTDLDTPVTKTCNCILVQAAASAVESPLPCIRCGDCVSVCPVGLQPQALYEAAINADFDAVQDLNLFDCIECGCCAYVCPSCLPLVATYRSAKRAIDGLEQRTALAEASRRRFLWHQQRTVHESRGTAGDKVSDSVSVPQREAMQTEIAEAIERVRRKRSGSSTDREGE